MSIRLIAKDLYRLKQEVEKLEAKLKNSQPENQAELKEHLRKQRAELAKMQRMLDGAKEPPSYRKPL
jgi:cell division protein FtsL